MNTYEADALLKGARRLDRVVLSRVFDAFYPKLFAYIVFRIGEPELSSQITGQVFIELLDALSKRREPVNNLAGWLFQTAHNQVQSALHQITFEQHSHDPASEGSLDENLVSGAAQDWPEYRMQSLFQKLSPEHQHFLALRFTNQYSIDDVSRISGKSMRVVKNLQFQALRSLQQALQARVY